MSALRTGSSAVDHHRKELELSPKLYDAELTIGLQNYVIGSLPLPLKVLVGDGWRARFEEEGAESVGARGHGR